MAKPRPVQGLDPDKRLRPNARRILAVRIDEVYSYDGLVADPANVTELHDMRIACKRLRYAMEMFEPALGEEAKPILKGLVAVQDHLGELQDMVVALATVNELRGQDGDHEQPAAGNAHREMTHEERASLGSYADALALRRDELKVGFAPLWTEISDESFRSSLALLIAEL